ncbi:hypothetical protein SAMN05216228_11012 [Rhizobium tibeticum]|uniref:Uncharacterized protein n=1 Tax=Rhizobium tibeticum TaxID=501024 RepID=A0ABY1AYV4_9HYPH|nr:hypothetical protein SAMN05216228_11012 [Rhizobium tibeticum]
MGHALDEFLATSIVCKWGIFNVSFLAIEAYGSPLSPLRDRTVETHRKERFRGTMYPDCWIKSGAPADRNGLLQALRSRGCNDTEAPGFQANVSRLKKASADELARLSAHARLRFGSGLSISRECDGPLLEAIAGGSLLVIGEPGAGKTSALVSAASRLSAAGGTVVLESVDRFPGVRIMSRAWPRVSQIRMDNSLVVFSRCNSSHLSPGTASGTPVSYSRTVSSECMAPGASSPVCQAFVRLCRSMIRSRSARWAARACSSSSLR